MEECDSGVGVAASNAGERGLGGTPWAQPETAPCINIATVGRAPCRLRR